MTKIYYLHLLTANTAKYSGCARWQAGACAILSPITMPPLAIANAVNAAGTAASGHSRRAMHRRVCELDTEVGHHSAHAGVGRRQKPDAGSDGHRNARGKTDGHL